MITVNAGSCVVCGTSDRRSLEVTRLGGGTEVIVCGSHGLAHARRETPARSVDELRDVLREQRARTDRRGTGGGDELASRLASAFTADRRTAARR
jgi:hypothetical protein